jgi:hypothetical protein
MFFSCDIQKVNGKGKLIGNKRSIFRQLFMDNGTDGEAAFASLPIFCARNIP